MLVILLRILPEAVRQFVLHHASGESYTAYRQAARRWEEQQRLFSETMGGSGKATGKVSQVGIEWYAMDTWDNTEWDGPWDHVDSMSARKCSKCGSKKHDTKDCTVDVSKLKCFRCNKYGHVSLNCDQKTKGGTGKGVIKGDQWNKGKSKKGSNGKGKSGSGSKGSKGKGKNKGKMNEMHDDWDHHDEWWYDDDGWYDWEVSQMWDAPGGSGEWQSSYWNGQQGVEQWGASETKEDKNDEDQQVGSLILAPCLAVCDSHFSVPCDVGCALHFADSCAVGLDVGTETKREKLEQLSAVLHPESFAQPFRSVAQHAEAFHCARNSCPLASAQGVYDESAASSLVSPVCARVSLLRTGINTFLNGSVHDTCSSELEFSRWAPTIGPLLSEFLHEDSSWWLLDSGASATVLAESCVRAYGACYRPEAGEDRYRAANGSAVRMKGTVELFVWMLLHQPKTAPDHENPKIGPTLEEFRNGSQNSWKRAKLKCLVGDIRHNIISATLLCKSGWIFHQDSQGFWLENEATGECLCDTAYFAGCPWVRLLPVHDMHSSEHDDLGFVSGVADGCALGLSPLTRATERELEQHRAQGHTPFHPQCIECVRGHSVFQHRRRTKRGLETEIQADFCFLKRVGEQIEFSDVEGNVKILVMNELATGCVGYTVVSDNQAAVQAQISSWLHHFGLSSENTSVVLHTDAEKAVGDMISKASPQFTFQIRRSNPQQHASNGGAERTVRRFKEALAVLRADLNKKSLDVSFSFQALQDACTYLALSHNHFGKGPGTDLSPLESSSGRRLTKPATTLFGCTVLAELSDAVRSQAPNETRMVEASFVHVGLSHGPVVQGRVRIDGAQELVRFVARNIRPIHPMQWSRDLCQDLLVALEPSLVPELEGNGEHLSESERRLQEGDRRSERELRGERTDLETDVVRPPSSSASSRGIGRTVSFADPVDVEMSAEEMRKLKSQPLRKTQLKDKPSLKKIGTSGVEIPATRSQPTTFQKTPRCKACDSGMVAPGIRHSAECKRRQKAWNDSRIETETHTSDTVQTPVRTSCEAEDREQDTQMFEQHVSAPSVEKREQTIEEREITQENMEVENEESKASQTTERALQYQRARKREADQDIEDLEREIKQTNMLLFKTYQNRSPVTLLNRKPEAAHNAQWFCARSCLPLSLCLDEDDSGRSSLVTSPEVFDGEVNSIRFESTSSTHESKKMALGRGHVLVWRPDEVIDDSTLELLNADLGFLGMQEEVENLEHCKTGVLLHEAEVEAIKRTDNSSRIVASRWVCARKSDTRVRCRMVGKDFNHGGSARQLGYSSPTPSNESMHLLLCLAGLKDFRLRTLDIAHAFMHSPLPENQLVILKLPLSISHLDGSVAYLRLQRALNGLRDASLHWLRLLGNTITSVGLWSDEIEPCVYQGEVVDENGQHLGEAMLLAYVDDLLLISSSEDVEQVVMKTIGDIVPMKSTGLILPSREGGGKTTFIGRELIRNPYESAVYIMVRPEYLLSTFEEYGLKKEVKASPNVPDIAAHLEKTVANPAFQQPLSPEAYRKFRKALGKLLWLAQVRHDLKLFLSLIGTQQAHPMHGTEQALRSLLRFLVSDVNVVLR